VACHCLVKVRAEPSRAADVLRPLNAGVRVALQTNNVELDDRGYICR
jgi:hypothetical protein